MVKNKTILGVLTLLLGLALTASAENYPYRSDVLWVTVPNHADWLYQTGEKATVEVQFYKYGIPQDGVTVCYELGDDMMPSDTKGSVTLKNGRAVVTIGTMKQPGFRDCRLQATIAGKTYKHHVKVGFSPDKLQPYTKMPADFDEFWDKSKSEIATFPLLYTKERVEKYSTAVGGWLGWFLGGSDGLLFALIAFVVIDYITGVMCAISDKKLSSSVGFKGICRKVLVQ